MTLEEYKIEDGVTVHMVKGGKGANSEPAAEQKSETQSTGAQ